MVILVITSWYRKCSTCVAVSLGSGVELYIQQICAITLYLAVLVCRSVRDTDVSLGSGNKAI